MDLFPTASRRDKHERDWNTTKWEKESEVQEEARRGSTDTYNKNRSW
jgi:hypothetical protein